MGPNELSLVGKHVMKLLVERRFDELEKASNGVRLTAAEMEDMLSDLSAPLTMPPEQNWKALNVQAVRNWPGAFHVSMDLYTTRGKSDLTVELTLHSRNGKPVIEVDDIQVR
ncbi:MAG: hypothetical protein KDC00_08015 [Flavobacteriales bacterium]|nr:hypothetical protein [Flavobacteriales bacterium]